MIDYVSLGTTPSGEDCIQVGCENYEKLAKAECHRFIAFIREKCGVEPPKAQLKIKQCPHDFGTYLDVVCYYDDEDEVSTEYAYGLESNIPEAWDKQIKTYAGWEGSNKNLNEYLVVGDLVDEAMVNYFVDVLPPLCMNGQIIQIGEPYSHVNGKATWYTLSKTSNGWMYCGLCHKGQTQEAE